MVVVERNAELIAAGALVPEGATAARILRVSVARSRRRRGLARSVVEELVRRARQQGLSEVRVSTDTPWHSAVELYRACGFTELGADGIDTHFNLKL